MDFTWYKVLTLSVILNVLDFLGTVLDTAWVSRQSLLQLL